MVEVSNGRPSSLNVQKALGKEDSSKNRTICVHSVNLHGDQTHRDQHLDAKMLILNLQFI